MSESAEPSVNPAGEALPDAGIQADGVAPAEKQAAAVDEDPEIDLGEKAGKLKRSEIERIATKRKELDRGAFKKFEEAKALADEARAIRDAIKKDPWKALQEAGLDPDQAAYERLQKRLQEQEMDPRERQMLTERQKLEQDRAEIEKWKAEQQTAAQKAELQKFEEQVVAQITPALEKAGLPKHPFALGLINQHAMGQLRSGADEPDFEIAAAEVRDYSEQFAETWLASLASNPEALVKKFPQIAKAVRDHDMASVKRPAPVKTGKPAQRPASPKAPPDLDAPFRRFMLGGD